MTKSKSVLFAGYVLLSPYPVNEDQKNAVEKAAEKLETKLLN